MRPTIAHMYKKVALTGAEIGVWEGEHAVEIMESLPMKLLYLIDPYVRYDEYNQDEVKRKREGWEETGTAEMLNATQERFDKAFITCLKNIERYNHKIIMFRMLSYVAVEYISSLLDFVYIDGNHAYAFVQKDIELYWPLVKPGGVIGGHNYQVETPGVIKAVDEFVKKHGLLLQVVQISKTEHDWYVEKPAFFSQCVHCDISHS